MEERAGLVMMAVASALVVGGSVVAAGYFGWDKLRDEMKTQQSATQAAVTALKSDTVAAVKSAFTESMEKLGGATPSGASGNAATDLAALKTMAEAIRNEQKAISENLAALSERQSKMTNAPAAGMMPPVHSEMASSIFYPLGVFKGPQIDEQVMRIVPMLKQKSAGDACKISVSGYSDTLGNDEMNLKLSQDRADNVAASLRGQGLKVESVIGWGERRLKVHTMDATKNEQNRRVVVDLDCTPGAKPEAAKAPKPTS